jgi:hypothetical protein
MSKCIAVLTRGYNDISGYYDLIKRNIYINDNLIDKSIDILFFHEGNIREDQQILIKNETPELNMKFINILHIAFNPDKKNILMDTGDFNLNYRHMCSFWFINFFNITKNYDKLLRIDEDCLIETNIDNIFSQLDDSIFICGLVENDEDHVTIGLNKFSLDFIKKYKNEYSFKKFNCKKSYGPYTNLFAISLDKVRNHNMFIKYRNEVEKSEMIYKRRWGDLPLWGEVIYYIFGEDTLIVDETIKYYHKSHDKSVN